MRTCFAISLLSLVYGANECCSATMPPITRSTGTRTDFSGGLDFPQFDPALGTLTRVTYSSFMVLTPTTIVQNAGTSRTIFATASGLLRYTIPGVNAMGDFPGNARRFDVNSESRFVPSGGVANLKYDSFTRFLTDIDLSPGSSGFGSYIGTSTFHLDYSYLYNVTTTPSSSVFLDAGLMNSLTGTVTYDYVPVPDFNADGHVDAADYVVWRKGLGTAFTQSDFNVWRAHFGEVMTMGSGASGSGRMVPEPTGLAPSL